MPPEDGGWAAWRDLVIRKLDDQGDRITSLDRKVSSQGESLAALKVKSGLWGFIAGIIPAIGILLWGLVSKLKG